MQNNIKLSDNPSNEDYLGLEKYCKGIAHYIMSPDCATPLTIAIQGDWGSGKTTALKLIQKELDAEWRRKNGFVQDGKKQSQSNKSTDIKQRYPIVWFDTWQYSHIGLSNDLTFLLLTQMKSRLEELSGGDVKIPQKVLLGLGGTLKRILNAMGETSNTTKGAFLTFTIADKVPDLINYLLNEEEDVVEKLNKAKREISEGVKATLEKYKSPNLPESPKLVVFIDDMDRLPPEDAISLMEGLKLFMDCDNSVFVLAVDDSVVKNGIHKKYNDLPEDKQTQFFEKIIQIPFNLPIMKYNIPLYIESLCPGLSRKEIDDYSNAAVKILHRNPRNIKRAIKMLNLYGSIFDGDEKNDDPDIKYLRFICILLQMSNDKRHPDFFLRISQLAHDAGKIEEYKTRISSFAQVIEDFRESLPEIYSDVSGLSDLFELLNLTDIDNDINENTFIKLDRLMQVLYDASEVADETEHLSVRTGENARREDSPVIRRILDYAAQEYEIIHDSSFNRIYFEFNGERRAYITKRENKADAGDSYITMSILKVEGKTPWNQEYNNDFIEGLHHFSGLINKVFLGKKEERLSFGALQNYYDEDVIIDILRFAGLCQE